MELSNTNDYAILAADIKRWGRELGFSDIGVCDTELSSAEVEHQAWIKKAFMVTWIIWQNTA